MPNEPTTPAGGKPRLSEKEFQRITNAPRPPLNEAEFHRLTMMEREEFMKLPEATRNAFDETHMWHFQRRQGDVKLKGIQTTSGKTFRQVLEDGRKAKGG
jgi:hypothetical protein